LLTDPLLKGVLLPAMTAQSCSEGMVDVLLLLLQLSCCTANLGKTLNEVALKWLQAR